MIARPALPAVLAALTVAPAEDFSDRRISLTDAGVFCAPQSFPGLETFAPWITRDPAEAWEILDARGLLPPEGMRGFHAEVPVATADIAGLVGNDPRFRGAGAVVIATKSRPATIPDLVAWESLGADAIVTAEALAVEACRDLREWGVAACERVVWRVAHKSGGNMAFESLRAGRAMAPSGRMFLIDDEVVMPTQEFVTAPKALSDMGIMLERVGAECVLCVPPIGGAS